VALVSTAVASIALLGEGGVIASRSCRVGLESTNLVLRGGGQLEALF